jgi:hypothetical protein
MLHSASIDSLGRRCMTLRARWLVCVSLGCAGACAQQDQTQSDQRRSDLAKFDQPATTMTATQSSPPEVKMAVVDLGGPTVPVESVQRYAKALTRLQRHCTNPRERLADMTVAVRNDARTKFGKSLSLLTIVEDAADMIDHDDPYTQEVPRRDCTKAFVTLAFSYAG